MSSRLYQTNLIPEARIVTDDYPPAIIIPVRRPSANRSLGAQLMIATSSGASHHSIEFESIGEYSRRIVGNISRRDRVVGLEEALGKECWDASDDDLRVSDTSVMVPMSSS